MFAGVVEVDREEFRKGVALFLARAGCFPNATLFQVDVGRSGGIWFDANVGID